MKTMKSFVLPLVLMSAAYAAAGEAPRVDRTQMEKVEKNLDRIAAAIGLPEGSGKWLIND